MHTYQTCASPYGGDGIHVDDPDNVLVSNQLKKNTGADLSYAGAASTTTLLSNKAEIVP